MRDEHKNMIRFLLGNLLSTQKADVYAFLWDKFMSYALGDEEEARDYMNAWQQFEGWIACHGLEDMPEVHKLNLDRSA